MSVSAQALRLHILMEPLDVAAVCDRLRVLNLAPRCLLLRCVNATSAFLVLDLCSVQVQQSEHFINRLRQMPNIRRLRLCRNPRPAVIAFGATK